MESIFQIHSERSQTKSIHQGILNIKISTFASTFFVIILRFARKSAVAEVYILPSSLEPFCVQSNCRRMMLLQLKGNCDGTSKSHMPPVLSLAKHLGAYTIGMSDTPELG